ncbi:MAG: aminotransferase class III-fold pyridoxal phosphate-dependent enzyme, partial [Gemmatimonadales bacterium]
ELCSARGTVLVFDEIKTAFRVEAGGIGAARGVTPDLTVVGKALGNGFPIAALLGPDELMSALERTWVSSTLATEFLSLAAARAVLETFEREGVAHHLARVGERFFSGLKRLGARHETLVEAVPGIPQMCSISFKSDRVSVLVARKAAQRGVLFKRSPYNFVSLAHDAEVVDAVLERLAEVLEEVEREC